MGNYNKNNGSQKVNVNELRKMVNEAVKKRLDEKTLTEGPSEISIRVVMEDMREVIVGSIVEDIVRETSKDEKLVEAVVTTGYEAMVREIIRNIDKPNDMASPLVPKRRTVIFQPK